MGLGDVLMSIGEAKRVHQRTQQPVLITDAAGRPVRSDLFTGVPYLLTRAVRNVRFQRLVNCPGHRPYIKSKTPERWYWREYQPEPADIVLTDAERGFAEKYGGGGAIIVESNIKNIGHRNKDWGAGNWRALMPLLRAEFPGRPIIQMVSNGYSALDGATNVPVPTFRQALAMLSLARLYIGPEGGLHHGAAAMGTKAVVIFGAFISPSVTGYSSHRNLFAGGEACGSRVDCMHCRAAMNAITPEMVLAELKGLL